MTEVTLTSSDFPSFHGSVRARWAPVLLEPISGSYERLVIAVLVVGTNGFHVEQANALDRLRCLYASAADGIVWAVEIAGDHLRYELSRRGEDVATGILPVLTGFHVGEWREAEGQSLTSIGVGWMRALSSLYRSDMAIGEVEPDFAGSTAEEFSAAALDRLPDLVLDYVSEHQAGLAPFFNQQIRKGQRRRRMGQNFDVMIDFAGSKLVANFGTLRASSLTRSIDNVKHRLWDLKVDRDTDKPGLGYRQHEMIVQVPMSSDPQVTKRQAANISDALQALEEQADQEQLRFRPMNTVEAIGQHILTTEAA
jgi:hypothetical protein